MNDPVCKTCLGLHPLCMYCQRDNDKKELLKAIGDAAGGPIVAVDKPHPLEARLYEVACELRTITDRYCYHSVFAVWLQYRLQHDGDAKATERAILDTNRTLEKLKANG